MNSLLVYPYVKLRVSCPCGYRKAYRLARVAEHYGADIALDTLLINLKTGRCPLWGDNATYVRLRCSPHLHRYRLGESAGCAARGRPAQAGEMTVLSWRAIAMINSE